MSIKVLKTGEGKHFCELPDVRGPEFKSGTVIRCSVCSTVYESKLPWGEVMAESRKWVRMSARKARRNGWV